MARTTIEVLVRCDRLRVPDNALMRKRYWAERHGFQPDRLELDEAARLFASVVAEADANDRFQKWFGYHCVDDGAVPGEAGSDVEGFVYRRTRRRDIWPVQDHFEDWDEGTFLTAVEFIHDHIAEPTEGRSHTYMNCGFHGSAFDVEEGQRVYREDVNAILGDYGSGFEIAPTGEVIRAAPEEMADLLEQPVDDRADSDVRSRVTTAVRKFRSRGARVEDRRDAVRDLADVLEMLQDRAANTLEQADERDLFHLANKFGIRHSNDAQKTKYDADVWLDWMFYHYLASIQAYTRLIAREAARKDNPGRLDTPRHSAGDRVRHPRWGDGIVVKSLVSDGDEVVTVAFRDATVGRKDLIASLADLETVDPSPQA